MFDERVFLAQLYSDIAEATIGLYENKDLDMLPYVVFIVGIDKEKRSVIFSPSNLMLKERNGNKDLLAKDWIMAHGGGDIWHSLNPRFIPRIRIINDTIPDVGTRGKNLEHFINKHFECSQYKYVNTWPVTDNYFVVLYRDVLMSKIPDMVWAAAESIFQKWHIYYKNNKAANITHPSCDINKIMEEVLGDWCTNWKSINECLPTIIKISSMYYESGRSRGSIAFTASVDSAESSVLINMKQNQQVENVENTGQINDSDEITVNRKLMFTIEHARQLRKLLETTKGDLSILVNKDTFEVYGIGKPDNALYTMKLTGHMEWHLNEFFTDEGCGCRKETQILRYKNGSYYLPLNAEVKDWYIKSRAKYFSDEGIEMLEKLLDETNLQRYNQGALFIISDEAENEVKRLCDLKRGIPIEQVDLLLHEDIAGALCAIDGALFLDKNGVCYGIGIILDGDARAYGKPDRGARYNSAKTYISKHCKKSYDVYAIVVSQDGYVDIISTYDEECHPLETSSGDNCQSDKEIVK